MTLLNAIDKLPGWLSIHEGLFLYKTARLLKHKKGVIVEIGSFQGKSTIYLAKSNQNIYAIDPHKGSLDQNVKVPFTLNAFRKNIKTFGVQKYVSLIKKTSQQASQSWNKEIKLVFIDGLHDEKSAQFDYTNWSPFLVDGGIVAMHDAFCGWEGAQKVALRNIILNNDYREVGVVGSIVYGIKEKSTFSTILNRARIRFFIQVAFFIHKLTPLPKHISFLLIHRVIKFLLINQFTIRRG